MASYSRYWKIWFDNTDPIKIFIPTGVKKLYISGTCTINIFYPDTTLPISIPIRESGEYNLPNICGYPNIFTVTAETGIEISILETGPLCTNIQSVCPINWVTITKMNSNN